MTVTLLGSRGGPPALAFAHVGVSTGPALAFLALPGATSLDHAIRRESFIGLAGRRGHGALLRAYSPVVEELPYSVKSIAAANHDDHLLVSDGRLVHAVDGFGKRQWSHEVNDRSVSGELAGVGIFGWRGVWHRGEGSVLLGDRMRPIAALGRRLLVAEPHQGMALVDPIEGTRQALDCPPDSGRRWATKCSVSHDGTRAAFWLDSTLVICDAAGQIQHRRFSVTAGREVWLTDGRLLVTVADHQRGANALLLDDQLDVIDGLVLPERFAPALDVTGMFDVAGMIDLQAQPGRGSITPGASETRSVAVRRLLQVADALGLPADVVGSTAPGARLEARIDLAEPVLGSSWIGGRPQLPDHLPWPHVGAEPMAFLGQINLSELETTFGETPHVTMPDSGLLLIFGHLDPEGLFPGESEQAMVLLSQDVDASVVAPPPGLVDEHRFDRLPVTTTFIESLQERYAELDTIAGSGDEVLERYLAFVEEAHPPRPDHRMLGFHRALHRDDVPTPDSPHQALLLQIDTDARLGAFWGPGAMLYVYVDPVELAELGDARRLYGTLYLDD